MRFSPADTTVSSTHRGPWAWAVASIALSIRFPVTVSTAVMSVRSAPTWQSSATRSWTPRSSASEDLASVRATSLGSRMASLSCSVSASRAADHLPAQFVSNSLITRADYVSALTTDKGQFLPDGMMPASGPQTVYAVEKLAGKISGPVNLATTYTNSYVIKANKLEGFSK